MGRSFEWNQPVKTLLAERLPYTVLVSLISLFFTYVAAIPIGIFVATHQYRFSDYFWSVVGFAGLSIPDFMLALLLMYLFFKYFGISVGGLFSQEYAYSPLEPGQGLGSASTPRHPGYRDRYRRYRRHHARNAGDLAG